MKRGFGTEEDASSNLQISHNHESNIKVMRVSIRDILTEIVNNL
jgi:hypothetical protein